MMTIKDTRAKNSTVTFEKLSIGQVYEDAEGIICIKTNDIGFDDNCISCVNGAWESGTETLSTKVIPLKTTLLIER